MVKAFGMVMTLGNVLFASTFLITDIVSEVYGKKDAKRAVHIGITTSIVFIIFSQWWLLYTPDSTDFAMPAMQTIFSNTPRLMITSMVGAKETAVYSLVYNIGSILIASLIGIPVGYLAANTFRITGAVYTILNNLVCFFNQRHKFSIYLF